VVRRPCISANAIKTGGGRRRSGGPSLKAAKWPINRLAAWIGLTPRQQSSGGDSRPGKTSKMGQHGLRRLLIIGASAVVGWTRRPASADRLAPAGSLLAGMLERKPPMLVSVAQIPAEGANRTARIAWALIAPFVEPSNGVYRAPAAAARSSGWRRGRRGWDEGESRLWANGRRAGRRKPVIENRRQQARRGEMDPIRRASSKARGISKAASKGRTKVSTPTLCPDKAQVSLAPDGASTHLPRGTATRQRTRRVRPAATPRGTGTLLSL
jgi:hypothetical protein